MSNSSSHAASITQFDLDGLGNTLGALLVGSLLSMSYVRFLSSLSLKLYQRSLWGVTCSQTYDYFLDNTDNRLQRSVVRSPLRRILFLLSVAVGHFAVVGSVALVLFFSSSVASGL